MSNTDFESSAESKRGVYDDEQWGQFNQNVEPLENASKTRIADTLHTPL